MMQNFLASEQYFQTVGALGGNFPSWRSVRLFTTVEPDNDLTFSESKSSLTAELVGTHRHLTQMDGKTYEEPTYRGDVCCVAASMQTRFAWEAKPQEKMAADVKQSSLIFEFDSDLFSIYCPEIITPRFAAGHLRPRNFEQRPDLFFLLNMLARELDAEKRQGLLFAETTIRLIALHIAGSDWTIAPVKPSPCEHGDIRLRRAMDFIHENFRTDLSLLEIARVSGVTAGTLNSMFKRATGHTPYSYVIQRRLEHARSLLQTSNTPLSEIALEAGFADQQHMTHLFRRKLRQTPLSFRRQ